MQEHNPITVIKEAFKTFKVYHYLIALGIAGGLYWLFLTKVLPFIILVANTDHPNNLGLIYVSAGIIVLYLGIYIVISYNKAVEGFRNINNGNKTC